jgi:hypothetical protein
MATDVGISLGFDTKVLSSMIDIINGSKWINVYFLNKKGYTLFIKTYQN